MFVEDHYHFLDGFTILVQIRVFFTDVTFRNRTSFAGAIDGYDARATNANRR